MVIFCSISLDAHAAITGDETEIGVGFGNNKEPVTPVKPIKPTVYEPGVKPTVSTLLPRTNELIQSLIVMLLGIKLLLVFIGMYILIQTYNKENNLYIS